MNFTLIKPLNQNKMKQTAVEFLIEQFEIYYVGELYGMGSIFDKAKEMKKYQKALNEL